MPDLITGVVVGIDISKGKISYGAYHPRWKDGPYKADQDAKGFAELGAFLFNLEQKGNDIWVAFEPTGVYGLCLRQWLLSLPYQIVQINPYHSKRIKELIDNSPEKSDEKDPGVIADLVWHGKYMSLIDLRGVYAELRQCSILWDTLRKDNARYRNQIQALLEAWFPELSRLMKDPLCKSGCAIIRKYKSPSELGSSSLKRFEVLIKKVSKGRLKADTAKAIWEAAKVSVGVTAGLEMLHYALCDHLDQLQLVQKSQQRLKARMKEYLTKLPSANMLLTIPGIGSVTVAGFLGECGDLTKYRSAGALEKVVGMNICRASSGKYEGRRHISKRGRARARYFLYEAALRLTYKNGLYHSYAICFGQRRGLDPHSPPVVVSVARKLIGMFYSMGTRCVPFDMERFQKVTEVQTGHGPDSPQGTELIAA